MTRQDQKQQQQEEKEQEEWQRMKGQEQNREYVTRPVTAEGGGEE